MTPSVRSSVLLLALGWGLALFISSSAQAATVRIDRSKKYQTIEGFGFFGARDSWWGTPTDLTEPAWVRMVIDDLGLTMWRGQALRQPRAE